LALIVWKASQASGLVVESFSVPPQFAQAGITGEVLSDDINSKLGVISDTANARSLVRGGEVSVNRDDSIRVEIPETGISVGQAWHYLRLWFGHERRVRGNLRILGDGRIALSVALDDTNPLTVTGASGELDRLVQQAAEHVYGDVEPGNFAIYLQLMDRSAEAYAAIARTKGPLWVSFSRRRDPHLALMRARIIAAAQPKSITPHRELANVLFYLDHDEEFLREAQLIQSLRPQDSNQRPEAFVDVVTEATFLRNAMLGDFLQAARTECVRCTFGELAERQAEFFARAHNVTKSRLLLAQAAAMGRGTDFLSLSRSSPNRARYYLNVAAGNWQGAVAEARAFIAVIKQEAARRQLLDAIPPTITTPMLAFALAHTGDFKAAHAAADAMPDDCYHCLRTRGQIAALEKDTSQADNLFARAVKAGPSIPFAYSDWGQSLLNRGQPDAAIEKFKLANEKGPHFADPLEGWGEALMAENKSHLALAKFVEAEKYAPNWGRLYLKWGEALIYAGKPDEAKKQFARAAQLDLTPSEKSELAGHQ
jgi:tetratricopeptide (TPR) repeat protein